MISKSIKKAIDLFYKYNVHSYQLLVIMYKRAFEKYSKHSTQRGFISMAHCCFDSLITTLKSKIIYCDNDKVSQYEKLLENMSVSYDGASKFYYWIDKNIYFNNRYKVLGNMPVDYSMVVDNSIDDIKQYVKRIGKESQQFIRLINAIENYLDKICNEISRKNTYNAKKIVTNLNKMKTQRAKTLEDALQRILFWNSLLHQTGMMLVGLGRLDKILDRFAINDENETKTLLKEFCIVLHKYYDFKSQALRGDTGQIIILGGEKEDGTYFYNRYTYMFLEIIKSLNLPDPKLMLRVSKKMPEALIGEALKCVATGNGSPLFSNDDVIIPLLIKYGYDKVDAYEYAVSACWEPVITGKTLDQNNIFTVSYAWVFEKTMEIAKTKRVNNFGVFLKIFENVLTDHVSKVLVGMDNINWESYPLLSLFYEECVSSGKDISQGGAKYNNYGLLTDGLSNVVNSLLNIYKYVFKEKKYTLNQVDSILTNNYVNAKDVKRMVANAEDYFGQDSKRVIKLTNTLYNMIKQVLVGKKNRLGGGYKIGLSSPNYLMDGNNLRATFDGRSSKEPLGTHISCDRNLAYTELISFASEIDYSGVGFNGNVVDFMVTPEFIDNNQEKIKTLVLAAVEKGFFQMQINVVSSRMLIDAKKNPEKYRNLIVRVWGFSAYYVDLPEKYKDMLINRALKNEGKIT